MKNNQEVAEEVAKKISELYDLDHFSLEAMEVEIRKALYWRGVSGVQVWCCDQEMSYHGCHDADTFKLSCLNCLKIILVKRMDVHEEG